MASPNLVSVQKQIQVLRGRIIAQGRMMPGSKLNGWPNNRRNPRNRPQQLALIADLKEIVVPCRLGKLMHLVDQSASPVRLEPKLIGKCPVLEKLPGNLLASQI